MSNNVVQKSIAASLGLAIASTGLFFSVSGQAQIPTVQGVTGAVNGAAGAVNGAAGAATGAAAGAAGVVNGVTGTPGTTAAPGTTTTTTTTTTTEVPATPAATTTAPAVKKPTIVDIALKGKQFSTLVAALKAADLVNTLAGDGPFTVFAPTNAAFDKLPKATLENLLKPENKEQLKKVLTYHVVSGAVRYNQLKNGQKVATVEGSAISVKIRRGQVKVNNAAVTAANIKASNGIIHVIDRVIMPAAPAPAAPAAPAPIK